MSAFKNNKRKSQPRGGNKRTASAKNKTSKHEKAVVLTGKLDCRGARFGFLIPDDGSEDVFIAGNNLSLARHGDYVSVQVSKRISGSREGIVKEIIQKNEGAVIGTVVSADGEYFFIPDDKRFGQSLYISLLSGAAANDKAIAEIHSIDGEDYARIKQRIGRKGEPGVDVLSALYAYNIKIDFDRATLQEAEKINAEITQNEIAKRRDLRGETIFTIDGEDSKDFDDAVSLESTDYGYRLGVYIADVTHYVKQGSALDTEALTRGTSVYLADRVVPMLPERLSNDLCSLSENADRLCLGVEIRLDKNGNYMSHEIFECIIRSCARLTYKGVARILEGDKKLSMRYEKLCPMLFDMQALAKILIEKRKQRGAIDFDIDECEIVFDAAGAVKDLRRRERLISHRIIEEFMVLTNEVVAKYCFGRKLPFVYRAHEPPLGEKLEALNEFLGAAGVKNRCPESPSPADISALLDSVPSQISAAVSRVTLRSMAKAIYTPQNLGHFGLASEFYCHFTSPIRRYPDLMIHRIIKEFLRGGKSAVMPFFEIVGEAAARSSATERNAEQCERKVDDMKKAQYMSNHIGEEYDAVISSVTEFGIFAQLDNTAEGLVPLSFFNKVMRFDARSLTLSGGGRIYKLGAKVRVIVREVTEDKITFDLVDKLDI